MPFTGLLTQGTLRDTQNMEDRSAQPFEDADLKAALRRVLPKSAEKTPD